MRGWMPWRFLSFTKALPSDKVQTWQQLAACQRQVTLNADFTKIPSEDHAQLDQRSDAYQTLKSQDIFYCDSFADPVRWWCKTIALGDQITKIPVFVAITWVITHGIIISIVFSTSVMLSVATLIRLDASTLFHSDGENSPGSPTAIDAFTLCFSLWNRLSYMHNLYPQLLKV